MALSNTIQLIQLTFTLYSLCFSCIILAKGFCFIYAYISLYNPLTLQTSYSFKLPSLQIFFFKFFLLTLIPLREAFLFCLGKPLPMEPQKVPYLGIEIEVGHRKEAKAPRGTVCAAVNQKGLHNKWRLKQVSRDSQLYSTTTTLPPATTSPNPKL